jgi:hypothetical protein
MLPKKQSKSLGKLFIELCPGTSIKGDAHRADFDVHMLVSVYAKTVHVRGGMQHAVTLRSVYDKYTKDKAMPEYEVPCSKVVMWEAPRLFVCEIDTVRSEHMWEDLT